MLHHIKGTNIKTGFAIATRIFKAVNNSWNNLAFKEISGCALIKISSQMVIKKYYTANTFLAKKFKPVPEITRKKI